MRLLVDTHCWLWQLADPGRLNEPTRALLAARDNEVYLSAASVWEIVIKCALGKLTLPDAPSAYVPARLDALGNLSLPIYQRHVLAVERLPLHHRDPFDRVLIAQALVEGLQLVTADRLMIQYEVPLVWADSAPP